MILDKINHTFQRYKTLRTGKISALPIVILMPHSSCNCRCVMCDIWKDNKNLKQLTEADVSGLLSSLKMLGTQYVVMSGGEALLNASFFRLCEILKSENIKICLLSTGITLKKHAGHIVKYVDEIIVSLDGNETVHDQIRNIPAAFSKLREGIAEIRSLNEDFKITARTVIHKMNYHIWPQIISAAKTIGLNSISFLPADVSSQAFNRETPWDEMRQEDVVIPKDKLPELKQIILQLQTNSAADFKSKFIAESPQKVFNIYTYYSAVHGLGNYPAVKCNAPWVSTVVEADGTVRPCFFHDSIGNIRTQNLTEILNTKTAKHFRDNLDMDKNETCNKCVCYLNLSPRVNFN